MSQQLERDPELALTNIQNVVNSGQPTPGQSEEAPHPLDIPFLYGGEEPPPEFTVYRPKCFRLTSGDVVSHDEHLNEDGEALYRFLLSQGQILPDYRIHCQGTHKETRTETRMVSNGNGGTSAQTTTHTVTVTDFRFTLDLTQYIVAGPTHWSVADTEPAFRCRMVREVQKQSGEGEGSIITTTTTTTPVGTRKPTSAENSEFDKWTVWRTSRGLPPWIGRDYKNQNPDLPLRSSRTMRQWADEYCASRKYLKEFIYKKEVYGWDREYIRSAVTTIIRDVGYRHKVDVDFDLFSPKVYIRPDNALSRALSKQWVRILLWMFLIYPFIWLFKRFHSRGGGRWKVCGGAYALKYWQRVPHPDGSSSMHPVGYRERDWVERYTAIIANAVINKLLD